MTEEDREVLRLENVSAGYGGLGVLHAVNLRVMGGEILSIVGPNGAGKSTVLKAVLQMVSVYSGDVLLMGSSVVGIPTDEVISKGVGYVPQGMVVFPELSVSENLEMGLWRVVSAGERRRRLEEVFGIFPELFVKRNLRAGSLSGGEQQMVALARALATKPYVLLLDEPSLGLSPKLMSGLFERLLLLRGHGIGIVLVEQKVRAALEISDRVCVLQLGRVKFEGRPEVLLEDNRIWDYYFSS